MKSELIHNIFNGAGVDFPELALEVFRFQYAKNEVYRSFVQALGMSDTDVSDYLQIPFLPVGFFKSHKVKMTAAPEVIFESSGTTGSVNSRHFVQDLGVYKKSFTKGFRHFYGDPGGWCVIGLLPSYLERQNASLVAMVDGLINLSGHAQSGFYLHDFEKLYRMLNELEEQGQKTILIGVSFALLDFTEKYTIPLRNSVVMETGGMKGRRKELLRSELHAFLKQRFGLQHIHSEYGMTELLSQAYSKGDGLFNCPPWMRIFLREEDDPLQMKEMPASGGMEPASGVINVMDLANVYSCSFIATEDVGKQHPDGSFEVTGRLDNSDLRGCSLMVVS